MSPQLAAILDGVPPISLEEATVFAEVHIRQASVAEYVAAWNGDLDERGVSVAMPLFLLQAMVTADALADEVARLRRVVASMGGEA